MNRADNNPGFSAWFGRAAAKVATWVGSPLAFIGATAAVLLWALVGPHYRYSDTWQLIINTGTTVVTFLIVFLIQNTQSRDARAIHLKLDEVIRSIHTAHNEMINIEKLSDTELEQLAKRYERFSEEWHARQKRPAADKRPGKTST
jgi:low affinity Fe/Cu permease